MNEAIQQQQVYESVPVSSDELVANQYQEDKIKNIIAQISPDNQLVDIERRIRGMKQNPITREWEIIDKNSKPISDLLVSRFISYLSSIMNQNTSLSNLSDRQVNRIMNLVVEYVVDELDSHADQYGLENNYTERTRIGHIICNSSFFVLNRSLNGQEARRMWKSLSLTESNSMDENKGHPIMDAMKVWK